MSTFMLDDTDAIDDVNPFVLRDFSLPGSVRQMGHFNDFHEVALSVGLFDEETGAFPDGNEPRHPRRNIDYGFTRDCGRRVKVGVSSRESVSWHHVFLFIIVLILLYAVLG